MTGWTRALLLLGMVAGCRHPVPGQVATRAYDGKDELGDKDAPLSVSLRVLLNKDGGERPLIDGESLHSGDRISLRVRANREAYLYVVHLSPDGSTSVLFPTPQYGLVSAGCSVRMPLRGSLYLQDPAGNEDLRVIATLRPLGEADRLLCEELGLPCAPPDPASRPAVVPCPPPPTTTERAIFTNVKVGRDEGRGVASLRFSVRHLP